MKINLIAGKVAHYISYWLCLNGIMSRKVFFQWVTHIKISQQPKYRLFHCNLPHKTFLGLDKRECQWWSTLVLYASWFPYFWWFQNQWFWSSSFANQQECFQVLYRDGIYFWSAGRLKLWIVHEIPILFPKIKQWDTFYGIGFGAFFA